MNAYQGGTVWLQAVMSFEGLQASIRRGVSEAFAGAEVDKSAARAFQGAEKEAGAAGEKAARRFTGSFEKLSSDRIKRISKDFSVLARSLPDKEFRVIEARLDRISKLDLSKVTNQARAVTGLTRLRNEFQGMLDAADKGQRTLSDPARWGLGFIRGQIDEINQGLRKATAPDPQAAKRAADIQRQGQLQLRAAREMGAAEQQRMATQQRAHAAMQREMLQGVKELDREQLRAHNAQLARQAAEQRMGSLMSRAQAQNVQIDIEVDRQRIRQEMQAIRDEIRTLQTDIQVGADVTEANAKISALSARLNELDRERVNVDVEVDTLGAMLQLRRLQAQVSQTRGARGVFNALLDAGSAANAVRVFNGVMFTTVTLGPLLIPVLAAISAGIFGVGAAALGAVSGVGILIAGLAGIGGAVGAMAQLDRAERLDRGGAGSARDAAAEKRQAIQDARSVADAQKSLARARRDGARSIADANRQVIDAEASLSRAHRDAAEAAGDAAERTADARRALTRANQDAAQAAEDAARRVRDAEETLTDAQTSAREAQLRLNEARVQARRDLVDLQNQLDSAQLSERSAVFELEEALVHLNVVLEDDQATQREKDVAQLRADKAKEALEQQQLETKRLAEDTKKANEAGVEGSDLVKDAKDRIADANERVEDAEQALADARQDRDRTAIDSAERLADAREAVSDAIRNEADVAIDSAQRINDAERALADARRGRSEAQQAASESIADAELALARAHEDIALRSAEAAVGTDSLATAQDNLSEALRGLSPAGVAFALWLYSLKPLLDDIRFAAQEGLLPGLQEGLSAIVDKYGPAFVDFVGEMAGVMGDLSSEFGSLLANNPVWQDFFATMADFGPVFLRQFGDVSINLLTAFASIMTAFAPFIAEMGEGLVGLTEDFSLWAASLEGSAALEGFFEYIRSAGPEINELIGNLFEIMVDLFIGLAPYADQLLDALIGFTDWLADMDPDEIANLALAIGGVVLVVQTLALALSAITGVAGLIGGVVKLGGGVGKAGSAIAGALKGGAGKAPVAGAAPATAAALEGVGGAAGTAGKKLIGLLGPVGLAVSILWLLWDAAVFLDDQFNLLGGTTDDVSKGIGDAWNWLWERSISPVWELIKGVLDVFGQMFETVGEIVYQIITYVIAPAFRWLWESTIGPWWEDDVQPLLNEFGNYVKENLPEAVRKGVNLIADIWNGLLNIFRSPIRAAIDIVWNKGIIGAFNWLADKVPGMTPIDEINIPAALYPNGKKFATGGILPGYTPGVDVHRFVSPTGGVLDLSGGEPIMRPEFGKVVGHDWVNAANAAARTGGVAGVQRFLGYEAHADGGFFGDVLDRLSGFGSGFAKALTNPLGFLDGVVDKSLDSWGVGGLYGDMVGPMVKSVPKSLAAWIGDLITPDAPAGGGGGVPAGAMGWQLMWSLLHNRFPRATLNSAYRPGAITAVGTPSYHGQGRAIDVTPSMDIFNWIADAFPNATELIYSPAGGRQLWNGRNYFFGEPTRGDHWDHVHWAMAQGGILPSLYDSGGDVPPGLTFAANASGKVESIVTDAFMAEVRELGRRARGSDAPMVDARGSHFGADADEIAWELDKLRRDKITLTGVFTEGGI